MELNECYCGRLFRLAEDYRDHLPCEAADLVKARTHPEYQAMLANLTNTQNRCTKFLMAMRRTRKGLRDHSLNRFEATALVERELDGMEAHGPTMGTD